MIFLLGISSCCGAVINVCWLPWFSDLAPARLRGRWFSFRDMLIAGFNLAFGLLTAWMLDTLPVPTRYVIIFALGGFLGMLDMLCFGLCEEKYSDAPRKLHMGAVLKRIRKERPCWWRCCWFRRWKTTGTERPGRCWPESWKACAVSGSGERFPDERKKTPVTTHRRFLCEGASFFYPVRVIRSSEYPRIPWLS